MLRSSEKYRRLESECLSREPVGIATYLLVHIRGEEMPVIAYHSLSVTEEISRTAIPYREHIVIEIQIFLVKSRYPVKIHLDRIAIECRQELLRDYILMKNNPEVFPVCPLRNLRRVGHNKIHITDERHPCLNTPEEIFQRTPVTETLLHHRNIGILLIILLPDRIVSINICNDCVHIASICSNPS